MSHSSRAASDRNLLFGILALQMDFISRDALIAAMHAWVLDKAKPLGQILREQHALKADEHDLLQALVQKHIQKHGNVEQSLAAVSCVGSVREQLQEVADAELHASLAHIAADHADNFDPFPTRLPTTVGTPTSAGLRFHMLRPHAKGGLGEVFVAQDTELHREVALKEIQDRYADDVNKRSRFVLEAEITGGLEHPGIVPVYGLGTYGDGRPYYAMRFIRGDSLQDAIAHFHRADTPGRDASERALSLRQLLGRFLAVCNAIAYAHSRGVLHRDLKPANVMLGKYGETLVVDWGLAKPLADTEGATEATEGPLRPSAADGSTPTQMGSVLGTPEYMSPEQAAGRPDQAGPASDVYSLGATLYCLLTGTAPFKRTGDLGAVLQRVQRGEFRPPRQIKREVPAALEAVCLKAMALKPQDRYPSPRALAADVERWLADEPVSAWPEPWQVRARRWVGQHRTLVTSTAAALLVATISLTLATALLYSANTRERWANEDKEKALRRAEQQAAIALAVSEFLQKDLLHQADISQQMLGPGEERDPDVKVRTLLDRASKAIEGKFNYQPLTEAAIRLAIGDTYRGLGLYTESQSHLEKSLQLRTAKLGPKHPDTLISKANLASLYFTQGKYDLAEPLYKEVLQALPAKLGATHTDTLISRNNLALLYMAQGKYDLAEPIVKEMVRISTAKLGVEHPRTLSGKHSQAVLYTYQGKYDLAEPLYKEVLQGQTAKLGADHPDTLRSKANLASVYIAKDQYGLAEPLLKEVLQAMTVRLGDEHPDTVGIKNNLATVYVIKGHHGLAEPLYKEVLQRAAAKLGAEHPLILKSKLGLAVLYSDEGKYGLAEPLCKDVLQASTAKLGADHPNTLTTMAVLSLNLLRQKKYTDAEAILRECLAIRDKKEPDQWSTFETHSVLGEVLAGQKKYAEAEPLLLQGYEGLRQCEKSIPPLSKESLPLALERLVQLYDAWGKKDKADGYRKKLAAERAKSSSKKK